MRLTPNYDIGCKRPTISDIYLPTFNNPCVELNTTGIKRITSEGIVTSDERELQFDAIVFATGFDVTRSINAFPQVGRENKDSYMQKTCDVAVKAILAKKNLRKKCVNRDKM